MPSFSPAEDSFELFTIPAKAKAAATTTATNDTANVTALTHTSEP